MFLRAVVTAGQCEDHRVAALKLAEITNRARVVGQSVVREDRAWHDIGTHVVTTSHLSEPTPRTRSFDSIRRGRRRTAVRDDGPGGARTTKRGGDDRRLRRNRDRWRLAWRALCR